MKFQSFKSRGSLQDLRQFESGGVHDSFLGDERVISLCSDFMFFDFLKKGKISAKIRIPESLFWKKQQFWWLFCGMEKGVPTIKKKKNELSNLGNILSSFFGVLAPEALNFKMLSEETYPKVSMTRPFFKTQQFEWKKGQATSPNSHQRRKYSHERIRGQVLSDSAPQCGSADTGRCQPE